MKNKHLSDNAEKYQVLEKVVIGRGGVRIAESRLGYYDITAANFFREDDKLGFITKREFLSFLYSLSKGQLTAWNKILELMNADININVTFAQKPQSDGRTSMITKYEEDDIEYSVDLMLADDLYRFVWQYSMSLLNCHTSLEELYQKALAAATT